MGGELIAAAVANDPEFAALWDNKPSAVTHRRMALRMAQAGWRECWMTETLTAHFEKWSQTPSPATVTLAVAKARAEARGVSPQMNGRHAAYKAYLESDEWRERRRYFLARAMNRCQLCKRPAVSPEGKGLDVHHADYSRLGAELDIDLIVLWPRLPRPAPREYRRSRSCPPGWKRAHRGGNPRGTTARRVQGNDTRAAGGREAAVPRNEAGRR